MTNKGQRWWSRYELEINLALLGVCAFLLVLGLLASNGVLTGAGLFGAIFFSVYSAYAYVRRRW